VPGAARGDGQARRTDYLKVLSEVGEKTAKVDKAGDGELGDMGDPTPAAAESSAVLRRDLELQAIETAAPAVRTIEEQRDFIRDDVARQLTRSGVASRKRTKSRPLSDRRRNGGVEGKGGRCGAPFALTYDGAPRLLSSWARRSF
jgi:hypothetical protein